MSRSSLLLLALGIVVAAVLLFLISRYSPNVATRTLPPADLSQPLPEEAVEPNQALTLEEYCQGVKQARISHCGMGLPAEDYECRTTHADLAYQECLANTTPEDIQAINDREAELTDEEEIYE